MPLQIQIQRPHSRVVMDGHGDNPFSQLDPPFPSGAFNLFSQADLYQGPRSGMQALDLNSQVDEFPTFTSYANILQGDDGGVTRGGGARTLGLRVPRNGGGGSIGGGGTRGGGAGGSKVRGAGGAEDATPGEAEVAAQSVAAAVAVAEVVGARLGTCSLDPRLMVVPAAVDAAVDVPVGVVDVEPVLMRKVSCTLMKETLQMLLIASN
ncbi:hypothetical protein SEVIR_9G195001v4 [Setaria viridis]